VTTGGVCRGRRAVCRLQQRRLAQQWYAQTHENVGIAKQRRFARIRLGGQVQLEEVVTVGKIA